RIFGGEPWLIQWRMLKILRQAVQFGIDVVDFGRERLAGLIGFNLVCQRKDRSLRAAVTYVALCVVSAIAVKRRFRLCAVNAGQA
ncbi:hypothetical protein, partial [Pseudomonas syringae]|uniref:hypothetical protein n=1 Tax=Pseudomonas syringae TaxID=317 RepID=UPI001929EF4A